MFKIRKLFNNDVKIRLLGPGFFLLFLGLTGSGGIGYAQELEHYLQMATENNPEIKATYAQFEAALQEAPQVSALPDPSLTASAFGGMETLMGTEEAKFQLMQMFPWFGTLRKKEEAASLMAEAKFQQYLDVRQQVLYDVASTYAELYVTRKIIELQKENLEILNSYRELSLSGFRSGNSEMVNVLKTDIEIDRAAVEIELLEEQLKPLKVEFNAILNRPPESDIRIPDTLIFVEKENLKPIKPQFENHPSVLQFEKQQVAYEVQQEVAQKESLPKLGVGLDYVVLSKSPMAMPDMNGEDMLMPMFSISLPIFRKKYHAKEKEALFMAEGMEAQQQAKKNELRSTYEKRLYELKRARKLIDLYNRQIESSQQANKLLITSFANATGDFDKVLQMNQDILLFKIEQLMVIKEGLIAQAGIEYLLSFKQK